MQCNNNIISSHNQSMHQLGPLTMTIVGTSKSQLMDCGGCWNTFSSTGDPLPTALEVSVWFTPPIFMLILISRLVS